MLPIGSMIRLARQKLGLSQRAFAAKAGIGQNMVAGIELGRDAQLTTLEKMAKAANLEIVMVPREILPAVQALLAAHGEGRPLDEEMGKPMHTLDEDI
ncbi:MAG: helix-turn-helix transcriptional regulator [Betaproteobacteria bacterium]|nr:helix-turn-helix transcriptional regulator [Betaproteobacteria bacterium]MDE2211251.1 helix-turn-helix transcriptional regulator [Betaproteobacteria bacterium]